MAKRKPRVETFKAGLGPKIEPCSQCPWAVANHGKPHPFGFYDRDNIERLWKQIRGGGAPQSCHPTDPNHPDHVACGAKEGSTPRECAGAVILIMREFQKVAPDGNVTDARLKTYFRKRKNGLTREGWAYWAVTRYTFGGLPFIGGPRMPDVEIADKRIALPLYLEG